MATFSPICIKGLSACSSAGGSGFYRHRICLTHQVNFHPYLSC